MDNGTSWRFNITVLESLSRDVFETRPATKRRKATAFGCALNSTNQLESVYFSILNR